MPDALPTYVHPLSAVDWKSHPDSMVKKRNNNDDNNFTYLYLHINIHNDDDDDDNSNNKQRIRTYYTVGGIRIRNTSKDYSYRRLIEEPPAPPVCCKMLQDIQYTIISIKVSPRSGIVQSCGASSSHCVSPRAFWTCFRDSSTSW